MRYKNSLDFMMGLVGLLAILLTLMLLACTGPSSGPSINLGYVDNGTSILFDDRGENIYIKEIHYTGTYTQEFIIIHVDDNTLNSKLEVRIMDHNHEFSPIGSRFADYLFWIKNGTSLNTTRYFGETSIKQLDKNDVKSFVHLLVDDQTINKFFLSDFR